MSELDEPTASRRAVLQLLAGTVAYSALSGVRAKDADARGPVVVLRDGVIVLQFDSRLRSRIALSAAGQETSLGDFSASEIVHCSGSGASAGHAFPSMTNEPAGVLRN